MESIKRLFSAHGVGITLLLAFLLGGILWGTAVSERHIERAVRHNFTAAGLLARLQVDAEKMRRYEKEMFIYAAVPDKRAGYLKEFDGAYGKLLATTDTMLAPSSLSFTNEERVTISSWKQAALFYTTEFGNLGRRASAAQASLPLQSAEQRASMTLELNEGIKAGKDRFRELLQGAETMRVAKETHAQQIATDVGGIFNRLRLGVLIGGLLVAACTLAALRRPTPIATTLAPRAALRPGLGH